VFRIIFLVLLLASVLTGFIIVMLLLLSMRRPRWRRTVATPYGTMMGPADSELRRTRDLHLPTGVVSGRKCLDCGANDFDIEEGGENVVVCRQCGRQHKLY